MDESPQGNPYSFNPCDLEDVECYGEGTKNTETKVVQDGKNDGRIAGYYYDTITFGNTYDGRGCGVFVRTQHSGVCGRMQKIRSIPKKPTPMPVHFVASILRRGRDEMLRVKSQYVKREDIKELLERAEKDGFESGQGYQGRRDSDELKRLRERVSAFEKASGLSLDTWQGEKRVSLMGEYAKVAMSLGEGNIDSRVMEMESTMELLQKTAYKLKELKESLRII